MFLFGRLDQINESDQSCNLDLDLGPELPLEIILVRCLLFHQKPSDLLYKRSAVRVPRNLPSKTVPLEPCKQP